MKTGVMGGVMRTLFAVIASALVGAAVPSNAAATPSCSVGTCNSTYCYINCDTGGAYMIFGTLVAEYDGGGMIVPLGIGVCYFDIDGSYNAGTYRGYAATVQNTGDWRIQADSADASNGGNDLVRLADPHAWEYCRTEVGDTPAIKIKGYLGSGDTYLFWGDKGDDKLRLCASTDGGISGVDCITNVGRADGRDGSDSLWASDVGSELWGGGDSSVDYLRGNEGADTLRGGGGNDYLWGDYGADTLYGDDGCDSVSGGTGGGDDACNCGGPGVNAGYGYECEGTPVNCGGCS